MARPAIIEPEPVPLDDVELTARLFRALGDATRLRIVDLLLAEGPKPQKEIVDRVGLSQGRVSQHLSCLSWCGFVTTERRGRETWYEVASPTVTEIVRLAKQHLAATPGDIASCRIVDQP